MPEDIAPPIYSTREDDPTALEAVDQFVVTLAEQVDALQDADLEGELESLAKLAGKLAERAQNLGYAPLAEIATAVADACRAEKLEDAQAAMVELTQVSCRIRRGHRGAA
jgi:HPt (histidine-containing phosphotransfer) domain-containing protein